MKIRIEGLIPRINCKTKKVFSNYELYYVFDDLRYGPIHEEGELSRDEMIKEFQNLYPQFHEDYCRIIKVGEERKIDSPND